MATNKLRDGNGDDDSDDDDNEKLPQIINELSSINSSLDVAMCT